MRDVHIMDIAMNLARICNWAADDFDGKQKRIHQFLEQTNAYIKTLPMSSYPSLIQRTFARFIPVFSVLRTQLPRTTDERLHWAEAMLTWSNILTHRASLIQ